MTDQINSKKKTKLIHKQNPKKKKMEFQKNVKALQSWRVQLVSKEKKVSDFSFLFFFAYAVCVERNNNKY